MKFICWLFYNDSFSVAFFRVCLCVCASDSAHFNGVFFSSINAVTMPTRQSRRKWNSFACCVYISGHNHFITQLNLFHSFKQPKLFGKKCCQSNLRVDEKTIPNLFCHNLVVFVTLVFGNAVILCWCCTNGIDVKSWWFFSTWHTQDIKKWNLFIVNLSK